MRILYDLVLHLLTVFFLPKALLGMLLKGKYKKSFLAKFGRKFPFIEKKKNVLIWVHAVSFGETRAIAPLIKKMDNSKIQWVFSSITETGHAEAKKLFPQATHVYFPLDFSYLTRSIIRQVKPDLVLWAETDFWWNFLEEAKKNGARLVLANGKLSSRSFSGFKKVPFFSKKLFSLFDLLCVQNETYRNRFIALGALSQNVFATGNLKLDAQIVKYSSEEKKELKIRLGIAQDAFVLTLGSTHDPEETILLNDLLPLFDRYPKLKVLLVPRHQERFEKVAKILEEKKISFSRFTRSPNPDSKVTLVDVMGVLKDIYAISDLAFVGGTLTPKIGGHNLIEPCFYGVPVLFGPYTFSQPDFRELLTFYKAGEVYSQNLLNELLASKEKRERLGKSGQKLCIESAGACDRTFALLKNEMSDKLLSLPRDGAVVSSLGS